MRFGMPLPERIKNAPDLWMGNELFYKGFLDLTSSRPIAMALGPLSLLTIIEYCMIMGIEGEQQEDFIWVLQHLDQKYLDWSGARGKPK